MALATRGGTAFAALADGQVLRSDDGGGRWTRGVAGPVPGGFPTALLVTPRSVMVATSEGLFRAADKRPWKAVSAPASVPIAFAPDGAAVLAGTLNGGAYRSTDGGTTWREDSAGLPQNGVNLEVHSLAARRGAVVAAHALGVSRRTGGRWGPAGTGLPIAGSRFVVASDAGALYAGAGGRLYRSADGTAWVEVYDGPGAGRPLTLLTAVGPALFATDPTGALYRSAGGATWESVSDGLPVAPDGVVAAAGWLLAALGPDGVWRRQLLGGMEAPAPSSFALALAPSDPNPFTDETSIAFSLSAPADIVLSVHDLLDAEVARVAEGPFGPGTHRVGFHAEALPVGIYRCRLTAGGQSQAHPMVLLR
ncbi:MAG TPA: hypothetical protein VF576_02610 [Rubricoccaceae bacterium]